MKSVLIVFGFLLFSLPLFSQTTTSAKGASASDIATASLIDLGDADWSFYSDEENKTYFIDFEKINFNLSDIVVKDKAGKIVFQEDVLDLPVNTIYELDLNEFINGEYVVELRSFTGVMRKDISLK